MSRSVRHSSLWAKKMKKLKCEKCGKTLLLIEYGKLVIKCPRCGHTEKVEIKVNEQSPQDRQDNRT